MRHRISLFVIIGVLTVIHCGCGTIANVKAPPVETTDREHGTWGCEPFGGVKRTVDVGKSVKKTGKAGAVVGTAVMAVDVPLSLVGDVVTLPVVMARQRRMGWATWWGEQAPLETDESTAVRSTLFPESLE